MKVSKWILLSIACLCVIAAFAAPRPAKVVRTIDSANPDPPMYNWHEHNRLGMERGAFVGVDQYNRLKIREESGDVVEVPFFHFTARDLGEIVNRMAQFPAETKVVEVGPGNEPLVELKPEELKLGPLEEWPNHGVLGGKFHSMNQPPIVEDIQGRRGVRFDANFWYFDTEYNAMVLDAMPANALKDGQPFTLSTWVLHPKQPDGDDCEMIMSWHNRNGNDGSGMDWKQGTCWGDFVAAGLSGDLIMDPPHKPEPMKEWTHLAYVYTGGGHRGKLRVYENGMLTGTAGSDYVPELRDPVEITKNSVVLKGYLNTLSNEIVPYVRGYIGEYDAHHFGQLRHIGRWDQMNEIGLTPAGEFSVPFKDLKPGTRYYYRMFATYSPESYTQAYEPDRRWAIGVGSFITAGEDGTPGKILQRDMDRYIFLGTQWGSRWYTSFSGPAGLFRGYIGDLKLYDRALTDDEVRSDAQATAPYNNVPAQGSTTDLYKADMSWKSGISTAARFRLYLDTDEAQVAAGTATARETAVPEIKNVELQPGSTHYWRVDTLDAKGTVLSEGPVWSFHVTYGEPTKPTPANKSNMSSTGFFGWNNTISDLKEQRLYLGQDADAVAKGTIKAEKMDGRRRDYYAPAGSLPPGEQWYWRVETVLDNGTVVAGPVWEFQTHDYFTPEYDGPASEPFPLEKPNSYGARVMEGLGHPTISTPRADEETMRHIGHATKRFLRKSAALRNQLTAQPCATTMSSPEGRPCVDGFACGSYGGMPSWNMTMHEMGHQILGGGLGRLDPDFYRNLTDVFNMHADNNAWLGDYASANIHENMAVSIHQFISGSGREMLLREDAPTFHLLAEYLSGDCAIDLHPAYGLKVDAKNTVVQWNNRGGIEDRVPGAQHYAPIQNTIGTFTAAGTPQVKTVKGSTAIVYNGSDALVWDRGLQYGFAGNRSWSVELWAGKSRDGQGDEVLVGWGSEDKGVRLYWGGGSKAWTVCGNSADWKGKPSNGSWHHLVFIFEGGGLADTAGPLRLFVDGTEVLSESYKLDLATNMPVEIGGLVKDGKVRDGFKGAIGQVRIYNYAISTDQVTEHYAAERRGYERTSQPSAGGDLYVDLDAAQLEETGTEEHRPMYPAGLCKPWVRSWANKGILQGRVHNDVDTLWHYSGSAPLYREVDGIQALRFMGKDRMISVMNPRGSLLENSPGTLEAVVYSEAVSPDEVVLEWGDFALDTRYLKPGWHHLAVNPDGGKSVVFIDGKKAGDIPGVLKPGALDHLHLGGHFDPKRESWYRYFNGAIAAVRVHEKTLTPEQIAANAKQSPVFTAHRPEPADSATVVTARNPALSWLPGRGGSGAENVYIGTDPAKLKLAGTYKAGTLKPKLKGNTRYFWRVGTGPVWSFETTQGEIVTLTAKDLPQGTVKTWKNTGTAGGAFTPADRGNLLGLDVEEFNGEKGFRMENGKKLPFRPAGGMPTALLNGPYSISFRVASDNFTEPVPFLTWGVTEGPARLWFGTRSSDRKLLTIGNKNPQNANADQLKMIFPEKQNAHMAFAWKTITITYGDGKAEMWYNTRLIDTRETDLSVAEMKELVLGWSAEGLNGTILLNNLQIYNRVLKQAEIEKLASGKALGGTAPVVWITANNLKPGERMADVKNDGTLKGSFAAEPDVDRAPKAAQVEGRPAVTFDGVAMLSSDFVLPEALMDAKPFTVEILALQDEPSRDTLLLAFSQEISDRYTAFGMGSPADRKAIDRASSSAEWQIGDEKPGQWVHLAYVYDGGVQSKVRLYRNGELNREYEYKTIDSLGGYPLTIGGIMSPATGEEKLFKGAISKVRVFDYARTAEEIAAEAKGE